MSADSSGTGGRDGGSRPRLAQTAVLALGRYPAFDAEALGPVADRAVALQPVGRA